VAEEAIRQTDQEHAPWHLVDARDAGACELAVGRILLRALRAALAGRLVRPVPPQSPVAVSAEQPGSSFGATPMAAKPMTKAHYQPQLEALQGHLNLLLRQPSFERRSLVLVFEGMDAAGKGGAIRRITHALDARYYRVHPVAAPSEHERRYPWLWRFWRDAPRDGRVALFDRSWYGRVLVERVEGFAAEADWMRAYDEINAFEQEWCRTRRHRLQVLARCQSRRAVAPLQRAQPHSLQAFQDHARRLAQPGAVAAVPAGCARHAGAHAHRFGALDGGPVRRQVRRHGSPSCKRCVRTARMLGSR
jgi:polyphosphate kinase 2 (PPK2 family)